MACDAHSNTRVVVSHTPKGQSTREEVKKKTLPCNVLEWVLRSYFSCVLGLVLSRASQRSCEVPSYLMRQFRAQVQSLH